MTLGWLGVGTILIAVGLMPVPRCRRSAMFLFAVGVVLGAIGVALRC